MGVGNQIKGHSMTPDVMYYEGHNIILVVLC
jgi:hypothetical protein